MFGELGRPFCYISCVEFDRPRQLLQAILHRLKVLGCVHFSSLKNTNSTSARMRPAACVAG